ncbi:hypothetical protein DLAC_05046 [Tieghemostelium lacteum]|uniref:Adenylate cyclase-associated CAP C-terminal domain-containing protein n=1 Tax=Tieghemostelium lacteum TaxID=361077 RepID=A0A151ZI36_TIELA|nr:hypothetical protein DLAC_05046 [Tieghemostelium lacteum]|eukprot:KYQ93661.1 hypothetical protein DLAC_05046 [Tieghemostelium lacteum]
MSTNNNNNNNNTTTKKQEEVSAQVIAEKIATVSDPNNSLPQPKGEEAIKPKQTLEDKKADAQLGSGAKDQEVYFVKDEADQTKELTKEMIPNIKTTVFFKGCKDGKYTVSARVTKIMIESCQRCVFTFKGRIFTNTIEAWKTVDLTLDILNDQVKTLQVDMTSRMNIYFDSKMSFSNIVWSGVNDMKVHIHDDKEFLYHTGFEQMKLQYPEQELNFAVDQFTTRNIKNEIITEQIVRLANGYPTTEREAREFDQAEEENKKRAEEFIRNKLKENGIRLGTVGMAKKAAGRNDPCPCGSGKKNKSCCNK